LWLTVNIVKRYFLAKGDIKLTIAMFTKIKREFLAAITLLSLESLVQTAKSLNIFIEKYIKHFKVCKDIKIIGK
jgi:hypothetical protein